MPDPISRLRIAIVFLALLWVCRGAAGSTALVRSELHTAPELAPVRTYAGSVLAVVSPVKPSPLVTVVLLVDSLSPSELESVKKDLLTLFASMPGHPMRIALLRNGSVGVAGPFASRAQLKSALTEIAAAPDASATTPSSAALLDSLCASVNQLGADWSRVLLVGELPNLDGSAREYASALLARTFGNAHLQLSWFSFSGGNDAWLPLFTSTGGGILHGSILDFSAAIRDNAYSLFQVDWTTAAPDAGFVISRSILSDLQRGALFEGAEIAPAANFSLPSIQDYLALPAKLNEATQLLAQETLTDAAISSLRGDLDAALHINPSDPDALIAAALFSERLKDYPAAARYRTALTQVRPFDAAGFAALGHVLVLSSQFDVAESPLQRAISLSSRTPQIAEDLARARLAHKNDEAALPLLDEALAADAKRQDLWFLQAQSAEKLKNVTLAIRSYEQGLALGGSHISEGTSLARLYLNTKRKDKARDLVRQLLATEPSAPAVRMELAASVDELQLPEEALSAWRKVLEVQADSGRAHLRVAQLLLASGDARAAEEAANAGLAQVPTSAGLYVVKAAALEKEGRFYSSRDTLAEGAAKAPDSDLLASLASTEDSYAGLAADAYARWAASLNPSSPDRVEALKRGFAVSVRDADFKRADAFAAQLEASGISKGRPMLGAQEKTASGALIPGGLDALAFAAHAKEGVSPERFFVEYARAVADRVRDQPTPESKLFVQEVEEYFQRIATLEAFGERKQDGLVIQLSAKTKDSLRTAEKVLDLLGLKLRVAKGQVELESGEKKEQAKKQDTAAALAIDEVGLQDALKAGQTYTLKIPYEWAAVYPDEKLWREAFYSRESAAGGLATAMLRAPKIARLYIGLSHLDRKTLSELLAAVPLKTLEERYASLVELYAPALAIDAAHAVVPGGPSAEPIWAQLVGASPATPGAFFRSLLDQDNGKLLAFFFDLSQLDREHQTFFTANEERTQKFYRFFAGSEDVHHGVSIVVTDTAFSKFLRSVPLDGHGHVDFPGSAEVWTVAKGRAADNGRVEKMMKQVSSAVPPEVEDTLLLRLAETHYKENLYRHTELENFLAVARVDAHHAQPLDEHSALLLAQNYADFSSVYSYFMDITGLGSSDYAQFFAALERIKTHPPLEANLQLGQFHALIGWIGLLQNRHVLDAAAAAKLFRYVCDRFNAADSPAGYTAASLDSVRAIVNFNATAGKTPPDDAIRNLFLGSNASGTASQTGSARTLEFERVLEMQKAPSLGAMFEIYDGVTRLANERKGDIASVKKTAGELPTVELPKTGKIPGPDKEFLAVFELASLEKTLAEMSVKLERKKVDSKELEKPAQEVLAHLQPQVTLALAGKLYAYYLRPSDLVVSEDALLLRKHHYFVFDSEIDRKYLVPESAFIPNSEGAGSYFVGGFAQFSLAAGQAASAGVKAGGVAAASALAAQLAAIRSAAWADLTESDQRLVSLRISVAREWIFESARRPAVFQALSEDSMGLLSLSRRADLLNGIETGNWKKVWDSITLPELFALGGQYLVRFKTDAWSSPVTAALRSFAAGNDGSRLNILGAISYHSSGCSHTHLIADAPYEEYERQEMPYELAERSAEFKLFLAFQADSLGLSPSALANIAEPLALRAFRSAHMSDGKDWRALLAAYAAIQTDDLKQALEQ
jgi:predicted Zn-dependent protease